MRNYSFSIAVLLFALAGCNQKMTPSEPEVEPPTLVVGADEEADPSGIEEPTVFLNVDDDRLVRWRTNDDLVVTLYGSRNASGVIEESSFGTLKAPDGNLMSWNYDDLLDSITIWVDGYSAELTNNADGSWNFRIDADGDSITALFTFPNSTSANERSSFKTNTQPRNRQIQLPTIQINAVGQCANNIAKVTLKAYNGRGAFLNNFTGLRIGSTSFEAIAPGLSRSEALFSQASEKIVEYLQQYALVSLPDNFTAATLDAFVTNRTERIDAALQNLTEVNSESFWESLPLPAPSVNFDESISQTTKRFFTRAFGSILRIVDVTSRINDAVLAGQITADLVDTYTAIKLDQVAFQVEVITKDGRLIEGSRSSLVSAIGPYPAIEVDVPCLNEYVVAKYTYGEVLVPVEDANPLNVPCDVLATDGFSRICSYERAINGCFSVVAERNSAGGCPNIELRTIERFATIVYRGSEEPDLTQYTGTIRTPELYDDRTACGVEIGELPQCGSIEFPEFMVLRGNR